MPDRPRGVLPRLSLVAFVAVALAIQGVAALAQALDRKPGRRLHELPEGAIDG